MAYDEALAERVRVALGAHPVTERRMFGGLAFLLEGTMALAVSGRGGLMVRVDPDEADELLERPGVTVMVMRGRPMEGWIRVASDHLESDAELREWARRGIARAEIMKR